MNDDKTLINKLWWLKKVLNSEWNGKEYKELNEIGISKDICKEVDELVSYIKLNY